MSLRPFACAKPARSGRILAAALALCPASLLAATWSWTGGTGNWSAAGNWNPATVPVSAATTDLIFGGAAAFTSTHDLGAGFTLNRLFLENLSAAESAIIPATNAERLQFTAATGPVASILQNGTGDFHLGMGITANAPLHFAGTGTGLTRLTGAIGGSGGLHFDSGNWRLSSAQSTFSGGVTVNTGAFLELRPLAGEVALIRTPNGTSMLGERNSNAVVINGGTIKVTPSGDGTVAGGGLAFGSPPPLPVTFGANGGLLDITNTNAAAPGTHWGTIGWQGATASGGEISLTFTGSAVGVVRFNGGQLGLSSYSDPHLGDWSATQNALRLRVNGTGPARIEVTNGAMVRSGLALGTVDPVVIQTPVTYRGVFGGDPTSGPSGTLNSGTTLQTGRIALERASVTHSGGVVFEDALQVVATSGASRLGGITTLAGTASGHPATVTFSGRATNLALNQEVLAPLTAGVGQNVLWLGDEGSVAMTIQNGATAIFDARVRIDQVNHSGVLLNGTAVVEGGGVLRIAQSLSNFSPVAGIVQTANVGDIILRGPITGQGNTAAEAVLDVRLPAPAAGGTILNGIPTPLTSVDVAVASRPHGGLVAASTHQIIINGSGFGGLRVEANARPDALFSTAIFPGAGTPKPDPVSNLAKLNGYLTPARLAGITGSGGYLTAAPIGQTWTFPAGGEWLDSVPVGLKVTNHRLDGADVSFAGAASFRHNIAVEAGALLDLGPAPFTFGPAAPAAGIGVLQGTGNVQAPGGLTVAMGGRIAPGLGGIGTLTVDQATVAGGIEIEASGNAADLLAVTGSLVLEATSQFIVPGTSALAARNYKVITAETQAGTFASTAGLPASHTLSYSRPGEIWIAYTGGRSVTWTGNSSGAWDHASQNWTGPTAFIESDRVVFNDAQPVGTRTVTVTGGDVAPASILVNSSENYTLISSPGARIVGTAELVKQGAGTLTLSGPAAFEGGVLIQQGVLQTASAEAIPDAGKVVVETGAQLVLGGTETIDELIVAGSVFSNDVLAVDVLRLNSATAFEAPLLLGERLHKQGAPLVLSQPIDLAGGARIIEVAAAGGTDLTLAAPLSNGGIIKSGAGTLLLAAPNALPSGIDVRQGLLRPSVAGAIPAGTNVTVAAAAALDLNGLPHTLGALTTSGAVTTGGAALTVGSLAGLGGTLDLGAGALHVNQAAKTRYDGAITTTGALSKTGPGSLALGGTNAIGGGIEITEGFLRIASPGAEGSAGISVGEFGTLVADATISTPVTIAGGTLGARYEEPAITADLTFAAGTTSTIIIADPEELSVASEVVITGTLRGSGDIFVQGSDNFFSADINQGLRFRGAAESDYSGTITAGQRVKLELQTSQAGPFTPIGSGFLVLTAGSAGGGRSGTYSQLNLRNNHTGDTILGTDVVIAGTGLVNFGPVSDSNAPALSRITLGNLQIGGGQEASVNKNLAVSQVVEFSTVTLTGGEAIFSPKRQGFGFDGTSSLALGPISELAPGSGIIVRGEADLFLTGANTYTGRTVIDSGTTWLGAAGALPPTTALEVNGGRLMLQEFLGSSFGQTVSSLSGSGFSAEIDNTAPGGPRDFIVNQAIDTVFAGSMKGNLNLIKLGAGTLSITGTAGHNGTTTVGAGAISVSNGGAQGAISNSVLVQAAAKLTGSGSVGNLTVEASGRLEPGEGVGILTTESVTFAGGSMLAFELNGTLPGSGHDRLDLFGSLTLAGAVQLELQLGFQPAQFDVFTLILNDGIDVVAGPGRFIYGGNTLENGEVFSVATGAFQQAFEIRYDGNGGNDVVLNAVPEPAAATLLICGALVSARRRRRP